MGCVVDRLWARITAGSIGVVGVVISVSGYCRLIGVVGIRRAPGEQHDGRDASQASTSHPLDERLDLCAGRRACRRLWRVS